MNDKFTIHRTNRSQIRRHHHQQQQQQQQQHFIHISITGFVKLNKSVTDIPGRHFSNHGGKDAVH